MSKIHIPVGLISNRNERPRTREGNFPFTARENAADRGVAAVKPAPLGRYESSRYLGLCLDSLGWEEDRRETNLVTGQLRIVLSICTASRIGGGRMEPLMSAEVRGEGFRKERIPVIRTSPDRAHVKNLPPRKQPRDEYEEEEKKKREKKKRILRSARRHEVCPARRKGRERERERVRIFEISSRKIIAYLRARYRAVMSDLA